MTTHVSRTMRELIAARLWLTVYQLPPQVANRRRWRRAEERARGRLPPPAVWPSTGCRTPS
ncbi:hypothetical protein OG467_50800 (plasmid) [Streptomyces sp. NBC_01361]|nr:hypothetical protein [Streptomyces sp. NBC_01361]